MMIKPSLLLGIVLAWLLNPAHGQVVPVPSPDQLSMLKSDDPRNQQLVFDFWRVVYDGHMDQAPRYMAETSIQHIPMSDPDATPSSSCSGNSGRPTRPAADQGAGHCPDRRTGPPW